MGKLRLQKCVITDPEDVQYFKLCTWNIMSEKYCPVTDVCHETRVNAIFDYLQSANLDFIFLQEVTDWIYDLYKKHPISKAFHDYCTVLDPYGQMTLSKRPMTWSVYRWGRKGHKQVLITETENLRFVNCHLTAGFSNDAMRQGQVKEIATICNDKKTTFMLGDFNFCYESEVVPGWMDLTDNKCFTFDHSKNKYAESVGTSHRFDRIYHNRECIKVGYATDSDILLSDHYPVVASIFLPTYANINDVPDDAWDDPSVIQDNQ
jgi:endonuclease/exonuclease/phosphatase family metal-dependent hydrolase